LIHHEDASNLEQLLESLIKMVGRANQNDDSLRKSIFQVKEELESMQLRISQLEWVIKAHLEQQPQNNFPILPHNNTFSKIPFHL
jgi:peptidoglycan hydrolase CwlO-like protein